ESSPPNRRNRLMSAPLLLDNQLFAPYARRHRRAPRRSSRPPRLACAGVALPHTGGVMVCSGQEGLRPPWLIVVVAAEGTRPSLRAVTTETRITISDRL